MNCYHLHFKTIVLLAGLSLSLFAQQPRKAGVPGWAKDVVWYQIFPERFANGDPSNDPPDVEPWGGTPKTKNYFGGDLKGIMDHLDYLQRLGITALYLNPINESSTNHKYHPKSYTKIDPHFGDDETFKQLIDACHKRRMRLIIDGVFNHTGVDFFAFEDIKKNEKNSRYLKWYNVHSFPVGPPEKPNYECWWGLGDLPKLMTNNPEVRQHLFDATRHMMRFGLDGWRLDVPNEISHDFWIEWRKMVKAENPNAYIVGEIWDDASPWLKGDQFDAVMNYRFRGACVGFIALENLTASQVDSILQAQRSQYPGDVNEVLQNLIGSHDTERFLTLSGNDVGKLKLTALMQMTYLGAPMIYYGDEIGMEGGKDPDCRRTMIWDTTKWNMDLFKWYQKLIGIRNAHPVFRRGSYKTIMIDNERKIFAFSRGYGKDTAMVFLNNHTEDQTIPVSFKGWRSSGVVNLVTGKKFMPVKGSTSMTIPARSGLILIPDGRKRK